MRPALGDSSGSSRSSARRSSRRSAGPGAIVSLVLGPFLIMAVFGLGYSGVRRPLETVVVAPLRPSSPADTATYQDLAGPALHIAR